MRRVLCMTRKHSSLLLILLSLYFFVCLLEKHREILRLKSSLSIHRPNYSINLSNPDILLVIRTSKNTQSLRMPAILQTWFQFSPQTTFITTNGDRTFFDRFLSKDYSSHIRTTTCKQAHTIPDLCCHSASEFKIYFDNQEKFQWLCRFDDDQYVNVPLLNEYLKQFRPEKELLYIGKPSMKEPKQGRGLRFWFATYGGGVCFSKALLQLIHDDVQPNEVFMKGCMSSNYPDDTHIAYILRKKYNINLTIADDFHHHIEGNLFTNLTNPSTINQAITLGFKGGNVPRFVPIVPHDVYHMQTLHCLLYSNENCLRLLRILLNRLYEEQHG